MDTGPEEVIISGEMLQYRCGLQEIVQHFSADCPNAPLNLTLVVDEFWKQIILPK